MRRARSWLTSVARLAPLALALTAACADDGGAPGPRPTASVVGTWLWVVPDNATIDILFVVDSSASMAAEQAALAARAPALVRALRSTRGGLPDLHVGVVSTDVGAAGQPGVPGCGRAGDDGRLVVPARCDGLDGAFISDESDRRGGRIRNYQGELADVLACVLEIGTDGCGFEMPLEAMRRALSPARNPGFRRPGAYLLVVFVTDEDDCSADDGALFGTPAAGIDSPLGPLGSFRCFEHGVVCDGDGEPRAFGTRTGCRPRPDSPYLVELAEYVAFLKSLAPDPALVLVSAIAGIDDAQHTVVVGPDAADPARPAVQPSCSAGDPTAPGDGATPPIRLASFVRSFPGRDAITSICEAWPEDALIHLTDRVGPLLHAPCLQRPLADLDAATPGLQPDCSLTVTSRAPSGESIALVLPPCLPDEDVSAPCWRLEADGEWCPDTPDHLAFRVLPDGPDGTTGVFRGQCLLR